MLLYASKKGVNKLISPQQAKMSFIFPREIRGKTKTNSSMLRKNEFTTCLEAQHSIILVLKGSKLIYILVSNFRIAFYFKHDTVQDYDAVNIEEC